jgi:hypothetical protein
MASPVVSLTFSADSSSLLVIDSTWSMAALPVPTPIADARERLTAWVKVLTQFQLDSADQVQPLDAQGWYRQVRYLDELGGAPVP